MTLLIRILFVLLMLSADTQAQETATQNFATINGEEVPYSLFEFLNGNRSDYLTADADTTPQSEERAQHLQKTAKDLIVTALLAQEARRLQIDKLPEIKAEMALAEKTLLAQLLVQRIMQQIEIKDEQIAAAYAQVEPMTMYRFKTWTTDNQTAFNTILSALETDNQNALERFSEHAKEMAWVLLDDVDPSMREEVKKLPVGGVISKIKRSNKSWKVVQLVDKNVLEKRPIEEEREILRSGLIKSALNTEITRLLKNAAITIHKPDGMVIDRQWNVDE